MRIKELRREKNITQVELAEAIGISHKNISKYENLKREPDISTLKKIADYFNVSLDYLVERSFTPTCKTFNSPKDTIKEQEIIKLYGNLTEHNQDLLIERAKTMLDLQTENNICSEKTLSPKRGA